MVVTSVINSETSQHSSSISTWLVDANLLKPGDRLKILDGAGNLTYQQTSAALKAQYPTKRFVTGEHGVPWIQRIW